MEVYLKRSRQPACLHLFPLSADRFRDFFAQPAGPGGQTPHLTIERFVSPIECLERHLKGMALRSLSDVSQLNALVEKAERLGEKELQILSGALDMEKINCLSDICRVVQNIGDYELIGGVTTERALGRWLVEAERLNITFPKEVRPYLDYDAIGNVYFDSNDGVFTANGYVQRRKGVPEMAENMVFRLTLAKGNKTILLDLPSSDERLEEVKRELAADSFEEAELKSIQARPDLSFLTDMIPMDDILVEEAVALSTYIQDMTRQDGELLKYCSALAVEEPTTFSEALTIAMNINDYERVPDDAGEYGKQVLRRTGADDELIDAIDGYMDFERLGTDSMSEDGVRRTEYGLIRRLSSPFPTQEAGQTMA